MIPKLGSRFLDEGILVSDDIGVRDASQQTNFVKSIALLLLVERQQFDFLQRVDLLIFQSSNLINTGV